MTDTPEEELELPVPDNETAFDDEDEALETIEEEDSVDEPEEDVEEDGFAIESTNVPNEDVTPDDPDELPPDVGDDMQGDWDLEVHRYLRTLGLHDHGDTVARRDQNLDAKQRTRARRLAVRAALLGLHHAPALHYTQSGARWDGIATTDYSAKGEYPRYADCSAFATWCLWNGLYVPFKEHDVVNGADWKAGYTGTMLQHGVPIRRLKNVRWGDCVLYGSPGSTGRHVAIICRVGKPRGSQVMVVSHGSEGGPYFLPWNYRSDIQSIRRYTHYKVV